MRRKTLLTGMLVIAALLTAVAGGAFAVFTDTESTNAKFRAGTINISLSGEVAQKVWLNPANYNDWKPGDSESFDLNIENKGSNEAWIQVYIYEKPPDSGPNFWDVAEWEVEHTGDWNQWALAPGGTLTLTLKVDFPQWVGNDYQGAKGELLILVVAKQSRNKLAEGYSCIALEDKIPDIWVPDLSNDLEGIICFKAEDDDLHVDLNAYGLTPEAYYQLDLTGGDSNNPIDGACTTQDDNFAGMSTDLFVAGYWNWGAVLEASCNSSSGGEGVYNYAGVYGDVQADGAGTISYSGVLALPSGTYDGVGAHVKLITGTPPGTVWTVVLSEMDYLEFTIPSPP